MELVDLGGRLGALVRPVASADAVAVEAGKPVGEFVIRTRLLHRVKGHVYGVGVPFILYGLGLVGNGQDDDVPKGVCVADPDPESLTESPTAKIPFCAGHRNPGARPGVSQKLACQVRGFRSQKFPTPFTGKSGEFQIVTVTGN